MSIASGSGTNISKGDHAHRIQKNERSIKRPRAKIIMRKHCKTARQACHQRIRMIVEIERHFIKNERTDCPAAQRGKEGASKHSPYIQFLLQSAPGP